MSFKTSLQEEQLLIECLKGERRAQKELYDKYKDAMFTIALRITNNWDDAGDSLQDAFIQVFRDLRQFKSQSTIGAWIKIIVIRTAIKKKKMFFATESLDTVNTNDIIEWPDELNGEYLDIAIKELPEGYRMVFLLTEVEGYTHKEVAEMLKISVGTSKSQLFHAKKMLQNKLQHLI
jgi:RNA polymerase sigma-70 factor (ECF subfamily)